MAFSSRAWPLCLVLISCIISISHGRKMTPTSTRVKAVNLGGWLVTEGWIKPSLFDGIPNKEFLNGTGLQFNQSQLGSFSVLKMEEEALKLQTEAQLQAGKHSNCGGSMRPHLTSGSSANNLGIDVKGNGKDVVAAATAPGVSETFEIIRKPDDSSRVRIKASDGFFLQAKTEVLVTADYVESSTGWGDSDPSVLVITISGRMQGVSSNKWLW